MGYQGPFEIDARVKNFLGRDPALFINGKRTITSSASTLPVLDPASAMQITEIANDSELGLTASLWTQDLKAAMDLSRRIEAGTVWINSHNFIDPNMPFGGVKQSGIERDFGTDWLHNYTEIKSVCIAH